MRHRRRRRLRRMRRVERQKTLAEQLLKGGFKLLPSRVVALPFFCSITEVQHPFGFLRLERLYFLFVGVWLESTRLEFAVKQFARFHILTTYGGEVE